ncbi:MAG: hypothetical protein V1751_03190 [Pseudomonadota bacterium]
MIEEVETSPLMGSLPVTFRRLSQSGLACPLVKRQREGWACEGDKGSSSIVADIVKNGRALKIRYACEGFNKKFRIADCGFGNKQIQNPKSKIDGFLHKLRRISSRNELTYQVLKGIIEHQGEYLRTGNPADLVPLTQLDLANASSSGNRKIDNSWISRLIRGLRVLTPSGEENALKFFFPSQKQVNKLFIKGLLDRERRNILSGRIKEPYSDDQIREMLPKSSLSLRSVAQCRHEMGIPSARRRISGCMYPSLWANFSGLYPLAVESVRTNAPAGPGIYELRLKGHGIEYPNGKTPIIYIGGSGNIKKRLRDHLGQGNKNGRIRDFLRKQGCSFRYIRFSTPYFCKSAGWREKERELYKSFVATYGLAPECNRVRP